jgi:uncharacterized protein YbjQ (UPF0145 family)
MSIILSTTPNIEGKQIIQTLGLVTGNTIRARGALTDFKAGLKGDTIGGELKGYTEMLSDARKEAIERMVKEAEDLGSNAIVAVRFSTSHVREGAAELLAYGTAVKVE